MAFVSKQTETDPEILISRYTLARAIADGLLVEVFTHRWTGLTGGKPLVAAAAVRADLSDAALIEDGDAFTILSPEDY